MLSAFSEADKGLKYGFRNTILVLKKIFFSRMSTGEAMWNHISCHLNSYS